MTPRFFASTSNRTPSTPDLASSLNPASIQPPPAATTYCGTVYPRQCDHVGHLNIIWYAGKFGEANWNLFARIGLTPTYWRQSNRSMAAVQHNITYKRELLAGDIVEIRSRLLKIREKSIRFLREMRNTETGEIASACEITGVHTDRQARRAAPFDEAIRRTAARLLAFSRAVERVRPGVPRFEPNNPDYLKVATATFERQQAMRTLGISIARLEPGEVDPSMPYSADFTLHHGFVHAGIITAGLDNACGIAVFTLMPPGSDVLTVEFKPNRLAPAKGERFAFRTHVVKPGRTLTVCGAHAFWRTGGIETLIATMTGALMALPHRG